MSDTGSERSRESSSGMLEGQLQSLFNRLEALDVKLERQNLQLQQQPKDAKQQPWWATTIQFLGLPALLIAMFLQFGQATEVPGNKAKTEAETNKLNTEELKARAELQEIVLRLEAKQGESASASAHELREVLPDLRDAVDRLQRTSTANSSALLVAKYLVIWGVLTAISLVFEIVGHLWTPLVGSVTNLFYHSPEDRAPSRWRRQLARRFNLVQPLLYPLPFLAQWLVQVAVFAALVIPLFNTAAATLGSTITLQSMLEDARHLDLSKALANARQLISR